MEPRDLFSRLEAKYGLPEYLDGAWAIESNRGRALKNKASGAAGHFQFMPGTAKRYGLTDPNNLEQSADAAARLAYDAAQRLKKVGAPVTPGNLYLMHQQGAGGASALLRDPTAKALDVLTNIYGNVDTARRAIELNGGSTAWTAGDFTNHITSQYYTKAGKQPPRAPRHRPVDLSQPKPPGFLPSLAEIPRRASTSLRELLEQLSPSDGQTQSNTRQTIANQKSSGFGDIVLSLLN